MTCHTSADRTHMKMVTWRYIGLKQSSLMCLTSANCAHTWALTTPRESVTLKIVQLTMPHLCKPCTHVSSDNTKRVCHSENRPAYNASSLQTAHTRELWQHEESLSLWNSSSLICLTSANCAQARALEGWRALSRAVATKRMDSAILPCCGPVKHYLHVICVAHVWCGVRCFMVNTLLMFDSAQPVVFQASCADS
jgi:hypothetical protein